MALARGGGEVIQNTMMILIQMLPRKHRFLHLQVLILERLIHRSRRKEGWREERMKKGYLPLTDVYSRTLTVFVCQALLPIYWVPPPPFVDLHKLTLFCYLPHLKKRGALTSPHLYWRFKDQGWGGLGKQGWESTTEESVDHLKRLL